MTALSFAKAPKWDADCCSREGCIGRARYIIEFLEQPSGLKTCAKHRRPYEEDYARALEGFPEERAAA